MIAIIDYGAGNIKSLQSALSTLHMESCLTTNKEVIMNSKAIILPGVGAFKDAMDALHELELTETLKQQAASGKPLLGICLGMQLFYEKSYEDGEWNGLAVLDGNVSRIEGNVKVPHMGWNTLVHHKQSTLLTNVNKLEYVYFVHSYYVADSNNNDLISSCNYGVQVPAIVQKNNIFGMQFHPEKSGSNGLQLLKNFGEMVL